MKLLISNDTAYPPARDHDIFAVIM